MDYLAGSGGLHKGSTMGEEDDQKKKSKTDNPGRSPSGEIHQDVRLWIGNLDAKLTEYHLLKLVQRFGPIENFDFLFHRTGPHAGLPRGYAFVTYKSKDSAIKCLADLHGKMILDKAVVVRWAQQANFDYTDEEEKLRKKLPALGMKAESEPPVSKERAINAIEAKLRAMEREKDQQNEFSLTVVGCRKGPGSSCTNSNTAARSGLSSHTSAQRRYQPYTSRPRFSRPPSRPGYRKY